MKKIIEVPLGFQNEERQVAKALKGVRRRLEYLYTHNGNLYIVFSSQEMKIKTIVKQMPSLCEKYEFLKQKQFKGTNTSVWREAGYIKLKGGNYLVFFEKTVDN